MTEPTSESRSRQQAVHEAAALMRAFAERTSIGSPDGRARRYLWTDAFAVCNFLALHRATGSPEYIALARSLVARVHDGLGRHRADDARSGWISGLPEHEGRLHPTRGGLRIGKPLPERGPGEPFDERLEWDRDGQYFHYLTRWMHALARMAHATGEAHHLEQAVELAEAAHAAFVYTHPRDGSRRMYWKMSIDLRRPLVASMGHHDPLDALLTYLELQAAAAELALRGPQAKVARMLDDVRTIAGNADWTTEDALGLGGLLIGAGALAQLAARGTKCGCSLSHLLGCAAAGLDALGRHFPRGAANHRLAFRELGLAIGLRAVPRIAALAVQHRAQLGGAAVEGLLDHLAGHLPVGNAIEQFWRVPANRAVPGWIAHRDINEVMLATSLVPDVCLEA